MSSNGIVPQPFICYLALIEDTSENYFFQAHLIVNVWGYPIDYGYTDKILVTPIQRQLYGDTLRHYISNVVCGIKILEKIEPKPSIILVNDRDLLELRKQIDIPILYLDDSKGSQNRPENELIAHPDFKRDLEDSKKILTECGKNYVLKEPFDRILKTIKHPENLF